MALNTDTYITTKQLLEYMRKTEDDFQTPFFKIYNNGAGATVEITDVAIVLITTADGTDTLTFADEDNDTISELITEINTLAHGWVINQLCRNDQPSTNLQVAPATACVGIANELTLNGFDELYLDGIINRATDAVNTFLRRKIKTAIYTDEFYDGSNHTHLFLKQFPITTLSAVEYYDRYTATVIYELTENTDYTQYSEEGYLYKGSGWPGGHKNIRITYTGGYLAVDIPGDITEGLLKFCSFSIDNQGNAGIKSERIGDYSITYKDPKVNVSSMPTEIKGLLTPYKKWDR